MPNKGSVSLLFPIRYNPLKYKGISMGKGFMTPLFPLSAIDSKGKFSIPLWRWFHRKISVIYNLAKCHGLAFNGPETHPTRPSRKDLPSGRGMIATQPRKGRQIGAVIEMAGIKPGDLPLRSGDLEGARPVWGSSPRQTSKWTLVVEWMGTDLIVSHQPLGRLSAPP